MTQEIILIVEDDDILLQGLRETLTIEGFSVLTARNGLEGLEAMKRETPNLILADVSMPVMDGFEFYNAIRENTDWTTIPFIFLTARDDPGYMLKGRNLGVDDYLVKPISPNELVMIIRSRLERSHQIQMAQLQQAYLASLTALANAIEVRNPLSHGHVDRVTSFAMLIAKNLGWVDHQLDRLHYCAVLHDIGKIHIPDRILLKKSQLNQEEWGLIKQHPITGAEMIRDVPFLADAAIIIRHHHERWDGLGYPDGLTGEEIPPGARIIAVADALDAMLTERPYSPACSLEEACKEIEMLSGKNYDPDIISAFREVLKSGAIQEILARE